MPVPPPLRPAELPLRSAEPPACPLRPMPLGGKGLVVRLPPVTPPWITDPAPHPAGVGNPVHHTQQPHVRGEERQPNFSPSW